MNIYWQILQLEIKSFFRSPDLGANLFFKLMRLFGILSFCFMFVFVGIGLFFLPYEELEVNSLRFASTYFIYLWVLDLVARYFIQQMPTQNIKPFLGLIAKDKLVKYTLIKTFTSYFNWSYALIFIPFSILLYVHDFSFLGIMGWHLAVISLIYINNFLVILLNGKDLYFYSIALLFITFAGLHYYQIIDITQYSGPFMYFFYTAPWASLGLILLMLLLAYMAYQMIYNSFYLDEGLEEKTSVAQTENISFLDQYGKLGTFIKNDIRLLKRNKYPKQILFSSVIFLFYGLLILINDTYNQPWFYFFGGLFVTGGFLMTFGAKVPSWESSYYPLLMSQNIQYREYLNAKWWLMVIATAISMVLCSFYAYFGWEVYASFLAAGIYNLGVNSHLTLLGGAYMKSPVDLNKKQKAFGQKNAFNLKVLLISLPKMVLPMAVYLAFYYLVSPWAAILSVIVLGLLGFLFKNRVFDLTESIYQKEKHDALSSFKNTNA